MRYAVTGATGFLGANLFRHLLEEGHEVLALIRKPNALIADLDIQTEAVPIDGSAQEALTATLRGCDGVFHLAGIFDPSPGGEARMAAVHVDATAALCAAAAAAGVRDSCSSSSITVGFGTRTEPGDEETPLDAGAATVSAARFGPTMTRSSRRRSWSRDGRTEGVIVTRTSSSERGTSSPPQVSCC